jgi:hypothetical protein
LYGRRKKEDYLERAALKVLLDVHRKILILPHVLLQSDLALELCNKLFIYCKIGQSSS